MSQYSFGRGRQMIIHDVRLNNPYTTPPTPLRPPRAENVWTLMGNESPTHVVEWASVVAKGSAGNGRLDALHFMGHGYPSGIQMGQGYLNWSNVNLFQQLKGLIKGAIVFFSCQVGAEQAANTSSYELTFGNAVSANASARVVACKVNQVYSWNSAGDLDFGDFEGVVYVYQPGSSPRMLNYSAKSAVNLNQLVFG